MSNTQEYRYPHGKIIIFAKAPVPGRVKTRLAATIGDAKAAGIYERLVRNTVGIAARVALAPVQLCVGGDSSHPLFSVLADRFSLDIKAQQGNNLGQRMYSALRNALQGNEFAVLIGTDCPLMTSDYLGMACEALDTGTDVVLGPAEDGGYVLIGSLRDDARIFAGIPWSTPGVLDATRQRLTTLSMKYLELETLWDIDNPEDYQRWRRQCDVDDAVSGTSGNRI